MNKIKQFFSGLVKNVWFGIKTSFLASKFYFSMKLLILVSTTAIPLVNIWQNKVYKPRRWGRCLI